MGPGLTARLMRQWESPPTWLAVFLALAWAQSRFVPVFEAGASGRMAGAGLIAAGLGMMVLAVSRFRRHRTTVLPREAPTAMIDTGIYRFSRNPIYLADTLILSGAVLRWDLGGLILVPVFMAVIRNRFILGEEAALRARFGPVFEAYSARTRRWI